GESWFGRPYVLRLPDESSTSQPHPEPNWPAAALLICSLKLSNEPKAELIASASSPAGSPPPSADNDSQNRLWLWKPPPLLRTAVGRLSVPRFRMSSMDSFAMSVPSMAAFRLFV